MTHYGTTTGPAATRATLDAIDGLAMRHDPEHVRFLDTLQRWALPVLALLSVAAACCAMVRYAREDGERQARIEAVEKNFKERP